MELLPQALVDGIMLGAIYIAIAIAFSLVFGVMRVIDFAVGEWIMLGAFTGYYLNQWTKLEPFLLMPIVFAIFAGVGYLLQPVIQRVLSGRRGSPMLMVVVFTFGLALMLRGLAQTVFGFYSHSISSCFSNGSYFFEFGSCALTISTVRLAGLVYALAATVVLNFLLKRTDFGLSIRALAQNKEAAALMGVNSKKTNQMLYGIYTGITAMTGVLIGVIISVSVKMGSEYSIFAFFVVVLAGMG